MLEVRTYGFSGMSRTKKAVLAIALVATGAVLLTVGLVLLLGFVAVGTVGALAVIAYRRLRGRPILDLPTPLDSHGPVAIVDPATPMDADALIAIVDPAATEPKPGEAGYKVRFQNDAYRRMISDSTSGDDDATER